MGPGVKGRAERKEGWVHHREEAKESRDPTRLKRERRLSPTLHTIGRLSLSQCASSEWARVKYAPRNADAGTLPTTMTRKSLSAKCQKVSLGLTANRDLEPDEVIAVFGE